MAVSQEIRDAEKSARIALLNAIEKNLPGSGAPQILQLAQAYNAVTSTDAPRDPQKPGRVGGFA